MLVLGYSGHRRHGWKGERRRKLGSRLRHARRHPTLFDAVTSFGEEPEDLPLNLFPLDGVGHDSAAAILNSGAVSAAAAEERFARFKHATRPGGDTMPPRQSAAFCLAQRGASIDDVEHVAFYCDFTPTALQQRIDAIRPHLSPASAERVFAAYHLVHEGTVSNERIAEEIRRAVWAAPQGDTAFRSTSSCTRCVRVLFIGLRQERNPHNRWFRREVELDLRHRQREWNSSARRDDAAGIAWRPVYAYDCLSGI